MSWLAALFATVFGGVLGIAIAIVDRRRRTDQTELQRALELVADARERRYNLLEAIPDGVYSIDKALCVTHINEEAERLLAPDPGPFVGRQLTAILSPLASDLVPEIRRAREADVPVERLVHFGAADWWIEIRILPAANETVVYLRDVTVRKRGETQLLESQSRLRMLMEQLPAVLWSVERSGRFLSISGAGLAALDVDEHALIGSDCAAFLGTAGAAALRERVFAGASVQFEAPSGSHWLRHHVEPLRDAAGALVGGVGVSFDISEIKTTREHLETAVRLDTLTRLPNRFALEEVLADALADGARAASCAVLFVDLDGFKAINDTVGHRAGDDVLRVVADRLRSSVDHGDIVARPGGDEFIIVLRSMASLANVNAVAERLLSRFDEPISTGERLLSVGASIGAALAPQHGDTADELLKNADEAMYRAKSRGRGTFCFYESPN